MEYSKLKFSPFPLDVKKIVELRPDRLNRRNFLADELSISDYGSSSGVDLTTPKIYSEGDFSAQQNQISLPPRYFVA